MVAVGLSDRSGRIVERIAATPEHPFFTTRGQVKAGDLGIGTEILTRAGPPLVVAKVERVTRPEGVAVYNFEVEGDAKAGEKAHSYFVGQASGGAWVHNGCTFVVWVAEPRGTGSAAVFEDGAMGARSLVKLRSKIVPALVYDNPNVDAGSSRGYSYVIDPLLKS
ncbi:MAG: Hint domain-containing protein [Capsulimonadales bacterium]|nr:Hint domain-containing protein [Capsulimonadales bacterium]